ncbi:MAG: hypothetical protein KF726_21055 [Anaerolineae bacterium]|nr:hypothetical protein [Anaerolineae bacterium]
MSKTSKLSGQLDTESMADYIKYLAFRGQGPKRALNTSYQQFYETTKAATPAWFALAEQNHWEERALNYDNRDKAAAADTNKN